MSVIRIETEDQLLHLQRPYPKITSGNKNNDHIAVKFDETWDCENSRFFASFYVDNPEDVYSCELIKDGEGYYSCYIPNEMLTKEGFFRVGVWSENGKIVKTSEIEKMIVYPGAVTNKENISTDETLRTIERMIDESGVIEYDDSIED